MTKDKFLYELVDQWLYLTSCQCILMENYFQKDRTAVYEECSDTLQTSLDYYDFIYAQLDSSKYSMNEVDEKLEYIVQKFKQESVKRFVEEIKNKLRESINNIDEIVDKNLFHDKNGKIKDITKENLIEFIKQLRLNEQTCL